MALDFSGQGTLADEGARLDFSKQGTPVDAAPAESAPPVPPEQVDISAITSPRTFNPNTNPADALALEAASRQAQQQDQALQGPPRVGPTVEAAQQLQRQQVEQQAADAAPVIAQAHERAKAPLPESEESSSALEFGKGMGESATRTAKALNLTLGALPVAMDEIHSAATSTTHTDFQDWWFGHMVRGLEERQKQLSASEDLPTHQQIVHGFGNLTQTLATVIGTTPASEALAPQAMAELTASRLLGNTADQAARAALIPGLTDASEVAQRVYNDTGDAHKAAQAGAASYLTTAMAFMVPASAEGGAVTRVATGAAGQVASGEAGRVMLNLALPENERKPFEMSDVLQSAVMGGALGAALGHRPAARLMEGVPRAPESVEAPAPVPAAARDLPALDFSSEGKLAPPEFQLVPKDAPIGTAPAAPEGIDFPAQPAPNPMDRAKAIEALVAQREGGIDYQPTPVPQAPRAELALGDAAAPAPVGNEIDMRPFMQERALLAANNLPVTDWLGGGDLLGRPFDTDTVRVMADLDRLAQVNPAAAAELVHQIETTKGDTDGRSQGSPARDAGALQAGEETRRQSEIAGPRESGAREAPSTIEETSRGQDETGSGREGRSGGQEGNAAAGSGRGGAGAERDAGGPAAEAAQAPGAGRRAIEAGDRAADVARQAAQADQPRTLEAGGGDGNARDERTSETHEQGGAGLDRAAHEAATSPHNDLPLPTEAQIEAGNYRKGHVRVAGLDISIENPAGSKRRPEWPALKSHYGYIRGTIGRDKDHIDVFVKRSTPRDFAGNVYVVDQVGPKGRFDEHKVMLGYDSAEEARAAYSENYTKGFKVGPVTELTQEQFRAWLASEKTKRAVRSLSVSEWADILGKHETSMVISPEDLAASGYHELSAEDRAAVDDFMRSVTAADLAHYEEAIHGAAEGERAGDRESVSAEARGKDGEHVAGGAEGGEKPVSPAGREGARVQLGPQELVRAIEPEVGWAEHGGRMIRAHSEDGIDAGEVTGRTTWLPKSTFWPHRPNRISEADARRALRKLEAGHRLSKSEQRFIDYAQEWLAKNPVTRPPEERRLNEAQRKRVEVMTPEEMRKALLTDELTGLGNRRAWDEVPKKPVIMSMDVDNLKWVNDALGHESGDALLRAMGEAIRAEGVEGYHISGDEFLAHFDNEDRLYEVMDRVRQRLADAEVTAVMPDGSKITKKGVGFSYGFGPDQQTAETGLQRDKSEREEAGQRAPRGEQPPGVRRESPGEAGEAGSETPQQVAPRGPMFARARELSDREIELLQQYKAGNPFAVKAARARARYERLAGYRSAHDEGMANAFPLGAGFGRAGGEQRLESRINRATETIEAKKAADYLETQAHAFDAGKINAQGRRTSPESLERSEKRETAKASRDERQAAAREALGDKPKWQVPRDVYADSTGNFGGGARRLMESDHRESVEEAISRGERVPPDVLADYPELASADHLKLIGETDAEIRTREAREATDAKAKQQRDNAPSADDFRLTGSNRTVDEAEARGQKSLFARGPIYYSELERQLSNVKTEAASPEQWASTIKNLKGVKADEVEWSGINDWLKLQGGKVTKQQVADYLAHNGVRVEETTLGGDKSATAEFDRLKVDLDALGYDVNMEADPNTGNRVVSTIRERGTGFEYSFVPGEGFEKETQGAKLPARVQEIGKRIAALEENMGTEDYAGPGETRYSQYTLPGGKNYRELLLTLPKQEKAPFDDAKTRLELGLHPVARGDFHSSHFDQPNILAHVRFNERTDAEGKKVLFIEEVQSDWAQKGKRSGFQEAAPNLTSEEDARFYTLARKMGDVGRRGMTAEENAEFNVLDAKREKARDQRNKALPPPAPFVGKTEAWVALALKRMIRYAAENGFDRVAWTNGEQQAARYDLSKHVDSILYSKNKDGTYRVSALAQQRGHMLGESIAPERLEEFVGKDVAKRIVDGEGRRTEVQGRGFDKDYMHELSGVQLKVGGEGMKAFYDKIVPNVANDVLKKLGGGRVGEVSLNTRGDEWPYTIRIASDGKNYWLAGKDPRGDSSNEERLSRNFASYVEADTARDKFFKGFEPQPGFDITPAMREKAVEGQPLFRNAQAREGGMSAADLRETLKPLTSRSRLPVRVHQSVEDLRQVPGFENTPANARGGYLAGRIHVVADNIADAIEAERTVARHEVTHAGVDALYGGPGERERALLDIASKNRALREWAETWRARHGDEMVADGQRRGLSLEDARREAKLDSIEEGLAYASEDLGNRLNGWQSFVGSLQQGLRKLGLVRLANWMENATRAEVMAFLHQARQATEDHRQELGRLEPAFARTRESEPLEFGAPPAAAPPGAPKVVPHPSSWNVHGSGRLDDLIYKLQDKHIDTRRVTQAVERARGQQLPDVVDPYLQEELYHGRASKRVMDFLDDELKPLLKDMGHRGIKLGELEEYLHARHAQERNAQIAKINPQLPDSGSGMSNADAKAVLQKVAASGRKTALDAIAARVDAINAKTREMMVSYGLEAPSTVAAWQQAYKNYVPLQREDMEHGMGTGQGFSIRGNATKRATGSTRDVVDILANVAQQRDRIVARGEKARVGRALLGLAQAAPNPDFWRVDQPPKVSRVDPRTGLVTHAVDPLYKSRENVIVVPMPDGNGNVVDHAIVFNEHNPRALRMAQAMKNLDAQQLEGFLGLVGKFTRYFSAVNTQWNPIFGVKNITRDVQDAMLNLTTTPINGKQGEILGNVPSALRGVYSDLRAMRAGGHAQSKWGQLFEEFQKEGGQTGYRDAYATAEERTKELERELAKSNRATWRVDKPLVDAVGGWLSDYNEAMENAVRLSSYKVAKDMGLSNERAASLAKNLTVNFNRKGQSSPQMAALYAFFNASVQGTTRTLQTLAGPKGKQIVAGGVLLGVLQAMALKAAGFEQDEPPEWEKEKNLIIPIGGKRYVKIPMPQGFLALPNAGRLATEYTLHGFKDAGKYLSNLFGTLLDASNPVGSAGDLHSVSGAVQMVTPTVARPAMDIAFNKDFTGRAIAREDLDAHHPTPGFTRSKDTATPPARWASEAINSLTGGTKYKPGTWSPTPDQLDYLTGQFTGGVGREISKAAQTGSSFYSGTDLPPYKIPLVSGYYGNTATPAAEAGRFYQNLKAMDEHASELEGRHRANEPVADYLRDNPEAKLVPYAHSVAKEIGALHKQERAMKEKGAPAATIQAIEAKITEKESRFNEAMRHATGN